MTLMDPGGIWNHRPKGPQMWAAGQQWGFIRGRSRADKCPEGALSARILQHENSLTSSASTLDHRLTGRLSDN